jgi:hypothetical protein
MQVSNSYLVPPLLKGRQDTTPIADRGKNWIFLLRGGNIMGVFSSIIYVEIEFTTILSEDAVLKVF